MIITILEALIIIELICGIYKATKKFSGDKEKKSGRNFREISHFREGST